QRLIGRSLRAVTEMVVLGERQILIDCDVLQADGGTRTASICGAYVALHDACTRLVQAGRLQAHPLEAACAAVSVGVVDAVALLDVEETGATLVENALLKARAVRDATGEPAVADDTGLEVDALDGAPGVRSARFAGPAATSDENVDKLLAALAGVPPGSRRAR